MGRAWQKGGDGNTASTLGTQAKAPVGGTSAWRAESGNQWSSEFKGIRIEREGTGAGEGWGRRLAVLLEEKGQLSQSPWHFWFLGALTLHWARSLTGSPVSARLSWICLLYNEPNVLTCRPREEPGRAGGARELDDACKVLSKQVRLTSRFLW